MVKTVGLPAEIKDGERRVALDPSAVKMLVHADYVPLVEKGAGMGSGFSDEDYRLAGARIVDNAGEAWSADLVCKVKEPQQSEWVYFRQGLKLFAYLHLAAAPALTGALVEAGVEAYAFETLIWPKGHPLLAPMSEIAGRAAAIMGAFHLTEGSGTLLGGASGVPPARVVVLGMGVAGTMAARGARGMEAEVTGVDIDLERLFEVHEQQIVTSTLYSNHHNIGEAVASADLVISAALVTGAKAPVLITRDQVESMRPGSVIVDLAIDQGGSMETSRPTSLSHPTYVEAGVIHYCVTNVPGQYPRTSSRALSAAVIPRLLDLARDAKSDHLAGSLNVSQGKVVHPAVAASLQGNYVTEIG
ncbi:MAG: alanine dehydrogenase [Actinomycetota bacterium]|nr:MAG: alanine dehydrogenase [Actinomycetota bacterium]